VEPSPLPTRLSTDLLLSCLVTIGRRELLDFCRRPRTYDEVTFEFARVERTAVIATLERLREVGWLTRAGAGLQVNRQAVTRLRSFVFELFGKPIEDGEPLEHQVYATAMALRLQHCRWILEDLRGGHEATTSDLAARRNLPVSRVRLAACKLLRIGALKESRGESLRSAYLLRHADSVLPALGGFLSRLLDSTSAVLSSGGWSSRRAGGAGETEGTVIAQ
jgi:hypothetical protein